MLRRKHTPLIIIVLVTVLCIIIATKLGGRTSSEETGVDTAPGIAYLKEAEAKDPAQVDTIIKSQIQQELMENRERYREELANGEVDVWSCFKDFILLGDSRAVGFEFYEYLNEDLVWAEAGATIRHLEENVPALVEANPSYIFLCYGLNDVSIGIWPTPEDYVAEFSETIEKIQQQLPDVTIIISSILIAQDPAFAQSTAWYDIPEYSAAVDEMCSRMDGVYFVNNDDITQAHLDLWDVDGIHLQYSFYPYWATNLIMGMYDSTVAADETE